MLYELLTRQQPFTGPTAHHIIVAILEKEPPSLSQFVGNVPDELERIINKAMAKNVTERYQTAKQLLTDLKTLKSDWNSMRNWNEVHPLKQQPK